MTQTIELLEPSVSLKEAAKLCQKSEKTLRRRIDAGDLKGYKQPMEYGGFMWMIDCLSLEEVFPGSLPSETIQDLKELPEPEVKSVVEPPPTQLKNLIPQEESEVAEVVETTIETQTPVLEKYLSERDKKVEELQKRALELENQLGQQKGTALTQEKILTKQEEKIKELETRNGELERELGEQKGTALTQQKVLEWFQQRALPEPQAETETTSEEQALEEPSGTEGFGGLKVALAVLAAGCCLMLILVMTGELGFIS